MIKFLAMWYTVERVMLVSPLSDLLQLLILSLPRVIQVRRVELQELSMDLVPYLRTELSRK